MSKLCTEITLTLCVVLLVLAVACTPLQCKRTEIFLDDHPTKAAPASKVTTTCDGETVLVIEADELVTGKGGAQ